jgi:hypothetical protein
MRIVGNCGFVSNILVAWTLTFNVTPHYGLAALSIIVNHLGLLVVPYYDVSAL